MNLQCLVSPICVKAGKKYAFVSFIDGERSAEGKTPDCKIVSAMGFDRGEMLTNIGIGMFY